jgi:hypothetical protein
LTIGIADSIALRQLAQQSVVRTGATLVLDVALV